MKHGEEYGKDQGMITTDRNEFVGCHFTKELKEKFRAECLRRDISMSRQISILIEDWLQIAPSEQIEPKRSNKRLVNPN